MQPPIRFVTTSDGVRVGYCTHGSGPPLLFVRGWISHLEGMWDIPSFRAFVDALAERFTVIRYDTRGQGLSDRDVEGITLEGLGKDVEAVLGGLGIEDVVLYGQAFGAPIALAHAARYPFAVSKVVLYGPYARPPVVDREAQESFLVTLERGWPDSIALISRATNPESSTQIDPRQFDWHRRALTGRMAAQLYRLAGEIDTTPFLRDVTMPALVMHPRRSRFPLALAQELAASLPDAAFVAFEGSALNPWDGDAQATLDAVGRFLGVELRLPPSHRVSAPTPLAVLFTDMASSTALTSSLGDARAQELVRAHDSVVREEVQRFGGSEEKHTGDGIMASFPSITSAVGCAAAIQRSLRVHEAPFRVKIGIDAGEPLRDAGELTGTVVQSARRIVDRAQPGEVFVSDVVRKLVAGKGFEFTDRGRVTLKGLPERVNLYELTWEAGPEGT